MRFLVTDGGQQSPVDPEACTGFFEGTSVSRQAAFEMTDEIACADVVELVCMSVVPIFHLRQHAGSIYTDKKVIRNA